MRLRLLIVEDDPLSALVAIEHARAGGHEALVVGSLRGALDVLATDLVWSAALVDLCLPDAEGPESVRRIRAAAPDLPIVVWTGDETSAAERLAAIGISADIVLKAGPRNAIRVLEVVAEAAAKKSRSEERRLARGEIRTLGGLLNARMKAAGS